MARNVGNNVYKVVTVTTGSRLHGGFYHIGEGWSIKWGGLGFYIDRPKFNISIYRCEKSEVVAPNSIKEYVEEALSKVKKLGLNIDNVCINVKEYIPAHMGLGSTTQLTLSIACGLKILLGEDCDPVDLSRKLGLAKFSGVGTLLFKYGGFVVDGGLPDPRGPREIVHLKLPESWRFVVVVPRLSRGLKPEEEEEVLKRSWRASDTSERLMARGALRLIIGIIRSDIVEAINGLKDIQDGTGLYFSRVQGSVFREDLANIAAEAVRNGIYLAQSSWGPTLYTLTTEEMASTDLFMLKTILKMLKVEGEVFIAKPRNKGATIALK
jgi:beta-ribofuranosylaminobenzene 5'-phosphate synthase